MSVFELPTDHDGRIALHFVVIPRCDRSGQRSDRDEG
jgi:hypothetical protein